MNSKYTLTIDGTDVAPEDMSCIERGNPKRSFSFRTLADSVATRNAVLFALGESMHHRQPLKVGNLDIIDTKKGFVLTIERVA